MQDHSEKRDFPRMIMDCPARYRLYGSSSMVTGIAKNLSGGGIMLQVEEEVEPGSRLSVEIHPGKNIKSSIDMVVEVNRCDPVASGFNLACTIDNTPPEEDVPLDYL